MYVLIVALGNSDGKWAWGNERRETTAQHARTSETNKVIKQGFGIRLIRHPSSFRMGWLLFRLFELICCFSTLFDNSFRTKVLLCYSTSFYPTPAVTAFEALNQALLFQRTHDKSRTLLISMVQSSRQVEQILYKPYGYTSTSTTIIVSALLATCFVWWWGLLLLHRWPMDTDHPNLIKCGGAPTSALM